MKCGLLVLSAVFGTQAFAMDSLQGWQCDPVKPGFQSLHFLDAHQVRATSDWGTRIFQYSIEGSRLTITMFQGSQDRYAIEQDGAYLRAEGNRFPTDYSCQSQPVAESPEPRH
jgi:hypothetical protein